MMMTDFAERALLPVGFRDILPMQAAHEAEAVSRLMRGFAQAGYQRVKPPLIEFEESLLAESGAATANHCFRVMDPLSHRMMGVRSDMTPQIARIAATRLANAPRPLRLSYAGEVLRVQGGPLRPERQFGQAGIELIGAPGAAADTEVIALSAQALFDLGLSAVTIDLSLPTLVPSIIAAQDSVEPKGLREALERKDMAGVTQTAGAAAGLLNALIEAAGPAERALKRMAGLALPAAAALETTYLAHVVALVQAAQPELTITIDPVENRSSAYHTGIAFTIFTRGYAGELGRGGRYNVNGESATGVTLLTDSLLEVIPAPPAEKRVFVPAGTPASVVTGLRTEGCIVVVGLASVDDVAAEAKRLECPYWTESGVLHSR